MKFNIIIIITLIGFCTSAIAQTKKATTHKTSQTKVTPKKINTANKTTTAPAKSSVPKTSPASSTPKRAPEIRNGYKTAVGIKFLYGLSVTAKHFFKSQHALEGILRYRNYRDFGAEFNLTALYEYHSDISVAPGLKWYAGGGAYFGMFSYEANIDSYTIYGPVGTVGLEYKLKNIPLSISADWQPFFSLNENSGFAAENGGIGIKYTF